MLVETCRGIVPLKNKTDNYETDLFAQEKFISKDCWSEILNDDKIFDVEEKCKINPVLLL